MHDENEGRAARTALAEAERVRGRAVRSGRWFSGYLAALGVGAIAWITLLEAVWPDGAARTYTAAGGALAFLLASLWAERRRVFPAGASRRFMISAIVWFTLYLLVIGPMVRWKMETSLPGWIAAATVMALPFFAAAARTARRS
ncbi:hypothetical protein [Actinocorallia populi]|uniref:hypothetical protein n=1 Tax=Actinocorallia populi TaxID=2079200 RepID=UPI000D092886|nr:hypothetical protein [Actinocorallia populi]